MVQAEEYVFMERIRVIEALFKVATSDPKEECIRRVEAINAMTALCRLQEGKRPRCTKKEQHLIPPSVPNPASLFGLHSD